MTEKIFPGPMTMIKIDGQKIKKLREQQGLTQLYLATAVDVTTDTISRWENKRYPSIKKENGIRLAEALEVDLEELLDTESEPLEPISSDEVKNEEPPPAETSPDCPQPKRRVWPILLLSATLLAVLLAFLFSYLTTSKEIGLNATRLTPKHYIVGQPFPVLINLTGHSDKEIAFILKETLPQGVKVHNTTPKSNGQDSGGDSLKWILKTKLPISFSYLMQIDSPSIADIQFSGTVGFSGDSDVSVVGSTMMVAGMHHWADSDKDNIISDQEILTVYDRYANLADFEDEIDMIEEIWLGEGYSWNSSAQNYEIIE